MRDPKVYRRSSKASR
uniref:Uncharacterized protein n=1 Tax=Rhizophora mucronata TaxID=61149 RepID=A0A2P2NCV3_RHIMU